ncbi:MAG TPA: hypothetical protein VF268_03480 [Gammaproteobacteria bacterium]
MPLRHLLAQAGHTTARDGGSAENAWSSFLPTARDGGRFLLLQNLHFHRSMAVRSAENARSSFLPVLPEHKKRGPYKAPFFSSALLKSVTLPCY